MGIARDLCAAGLGRYKPQVPDPIRGHGDCPVEIGIETPTCAQFGGVLIRGVQNKPSPDWMQDRLRAVGINPKNMLVDVTNFISLDRARPLHAYDAAKLRGRIFARDARDGETLEALDDKTYTLKPGMCVICDDSGVIGLGGVMGGTSTAVSEDTTDVFIESAWFDPMVTARTGRDTGIISDARYRFERGVDIHSVEDGLAVAVELITRHCGGEATKPLVIGEPAAKEEKVRFNPSDVERLTGLKVRPASMRRMLKDLGFTVEEGGAEAWYVTVPGWRFDVEGSADFVEEVARLTGFDSLPMEPLPPLGDTPQQITTPIEERMRTCRRVMAARGYDEAVTWSFMRRDWAGLFGGGEDALIVANPVASDLDCMRPSLLANLALAAQRNVDHGARTVRLFEAGPLYRGDGPKDQRRAVAGLIRPGDERHWSGGSRPDVYTVKADIFAVLAAMDQPPERFQIADPSQPHWHPGQSASLKLGPKTTVAHFGALHPRVLKALDVEGPVYAFEMNLQALPQMKAKATKTKPVLDLPDRSPIRRDFAFLLDESVPAGDLVRAASGADKTLIEAVTVFDIYQGKGVAEGKKSLAFEVVIQPRGETLKDADIDALADKVVKAVEKATGGTLRG
jgi:phenylalanyl-tRNA synthetase beta chain